MELGADVFVVHDGCTPRMMADSAGHNEVVLVVFDPAQVSLAEILQVCWESHDPTQGMRQGNDVGTQYRSGLYYYDDKQKNLVLASRDAYQKKLTAAGFGEITTEICEVPEYYFAEEYHQQYLEKGGRGGRGQSAEKGCTDTIRCYG